MATQAPTDRNTALTLSTERPASTSSGYLMLVVMLIAIVVAIGGATQIDASPALGVPLLLAGSLVFAFVIVGFYMLQPNQAAAITLFGSYRGTDRTTGLRWVVPWYGKKKLSVRASNIISDKIKVNALRGNPIEIAAQVVWRVTDTAQALFDVDNYKTFVLVQLAAAVRTIGSRYPNDAIDHQEVPL